VFYQLPPVGNPVSLDLKSDLDLPSFFSSRQTKFYSSGTAALAAAIKAAMASKKSVNPDAVEVILPAYACPDLVSAAVFAGARPVLVDLEPDRPWMDLSLLTDAITRNTVAIVAVNLFGISERWLQLRRIAEQFEVLLIEDSAQYFPGASEASNWHGDLVVFSFGRGKPVSLLGGGAVVSEGKTLHDLLSGTVHDDLGLKDKMIFELKAWIYNTMISPALYWLPQSLPFLHLGETRYHTLRDIEAMDKVRFKLLATNIGRYQADIKAAKRCQQISLMLERQDKAVDLPEACGSLPNRRLLRYPLLLDEGARDKAYQKLKQAGLGPSIMYPASLPNISGLGGLLDGEQCFPNAEDFAARLLTLPTHSHVTEKNIDDMGVILREI
jgi:dTDP-4-amino-4,6-dideoxygalactose transaminase